MLARKRNQRSLRFERLEKRAMLAGNVMASVARHVLTIQGDGDAAGNAIIVTQTGRAGYSVAQDPANATSINGAAGGSFSAGRIRAVRIIMGAGPDSVTINGNHLRKTDINMGGGDDALTFSNALPHGRKSTVDGGAGTDRLTTVGKVVTANGETGRHHRRQRLNVLNFETFA